MVKKKIKLISIIIVILLILIGLVFGIRKYLINKHENNIKDYDWLSNNVEIIESSDYGQDIYVVNKSSDIDIYNDNYRKVIREKYNHLAIGDYTFDNPLLIYNLYGTNTLSLNTKFTTDEDSYIEYTISVDNDEINDYSNILKNEGENNLTKDHEYQIIGFVPGYKNYLNLELKNANNETIDQKNITLDLTNVKINSEVIIKSENGTSTKELENGLYTVLGNDSDEQDYVSMYDNDGVIRSEIPIIGYRAHALLFKDDLMYFSISQTRIAAMNNQGEIKEIYRTGHYYLHHDYTFDDEGNLLVLANNLNKDTEEDCIIKINLTTKEVTEVLDLEDIFADYVDTCTLDTESSRDEGEDGLDWIHLNSIEFVNGDVILSSRETSSIIKISNINTDPQLEYILSDPSLWEDTPYEEYVYTKLGDFKIHAGQHSVRYTPTNDEDIYYLTFFNNNYGKQTSQPDFDYSSIGITNTKPFEGDESYYYVYEVNEKKKTFRLVDSFAVEYSGIVSSVQTQNNDNILVDSGTKGIFAEYDEDHNLIKKFTVKLNKYMAYRVLKYDFNNFWFKN